MNTVSITEPTQGIPADALAVGEFGVITSVGFGVTDAHGHVVLRSQTELIDLTDTTRTFRLFGARVCRLETGTVLRITVGTPISLNDDQLRKVQCQLRAGNKIDAIKLVREYTRAGLKEAKDYVDHLEF